MNLDASCQEKDRKVDLIDTFGTVLQSSSHLEMNEPRKKNSVFFFFSKFANDTRVWKVTLTSKLFFYT